LALACAGLIGEPARAAEVSESSPNVAVRIAGAEEIAGRLQAALDDALHRLGVVAEVQRIEGAQKPDIAERGPGAAAPVARLWIDLTQEHSVALLLVDDRHERVFVRELPLTSGLDEVALEQLVLSVASSIEAILAGQTIGVARRDYEASLRSQPRAPAPVVSVAPPKKAVPKTNFWGSLSGAYAVQVLGPGAIVHGPSLGFELQRPTFGVGLQVLGRLPVRVQEPSTTLRLTTVGFRGRAWGSLPLSQSPSRAGFQTLALVSGLGLGADFTQVSPRSTALEGYVASLPYWAADGLLQGFLGLAYRAPSWSLVGSLGVDFAPQAVRYALETPAGPRDVFRPARWRPFLEVELSARFME